MPKRPSVAYQSPYADPPSLKTPADELTPLAIILHTMRQRFADGDLDAAVALARIAAPYLHPRAQAAASPMDLAVMQDADLDTVRPQD